MRTNSKKELIFETPSSIGTTLSFSTLVFNGTNKFHMAFCILVAILFVHALTGFYLEIWSAPTSIWRFPIEIGIGYLIGFLCFAYLKFKNVITLHHDKLIFTNFSGKKEININEIDSIAYNMIPVLTSTGVQFFSYYLYAQVKGKHIRLHRGYITEAMARHLIGRINLGK